jgi:hypothetical protein
MWNYSLLPAPRSTLGCERVLFIRCPCKWREVGLARVSGRRAQNKHTRGGIIIRCARVAAFASCLSTNQPTTHSTTCLTENSPRDSLSPATSLSLADPSTWTNSWRAQWRMISDFALFDKYDEHRLEKSLLTKSPAIMSLQWNGENRGSGLEKHIEWRVFFLIHVIIVLWGHYVVAAPLSNWDQRANKHAGWALMWLRNAF